MQILEFIKNYWVLITFIAGGISTFFMFIVYMIQAVKCSLRNDILDIYDRAVARGKRITHYELEALTHSSDVYFKLKGNSFVRALMEKVKNFEIIDQKEGEKDEYNSRNYNYRTNTDRRRKKKIIMFIVIIFQFKIL